MTAGAKPDFRLVLAQGVEAAVDREGHAMGVSAEICHRAKEILILRMLARFPTEEVLSSVTALHPFLRKSARRQLVRELKRQAKAPAIMLADDMDRRALAPTSEDPQRQAEERHETAHLMLKIQAGLSELSAQEREILDLRLKGFNFKTIAAILGTTSNAVYVQGSQGVKKLRGLYHQPA